MRRSDLRPFSFLRNFTQAIRNIRRFTCSFLAAFLFIGAPAGITAEQNPNFKVPPVKIPLKIKDETVTIVASAMISQISAAHDVYTFNLELRADLADLQRNMTGLLASQLDKDDKCGERIAIQNASLIPTEPSSLATVQLHYERWACVKAFGRQQTKKLVGGDAIVPLKLTPVVAENNAELTLVPEVGNIQADGSLGELLRSGALGEMIRDKIRNAVVSTLQKGTNLSETLPPAVQGYVSILDARFKSGDAGQLVVVLLGKTRITKEQVRALSQQVKERLASASR
jgi:hypothetical protein